MVDVVSSWSMPPGSGHIDPNEKLFLFGYSCKLFPQDEKSDYIDKGRHLIPWMGDKSVMIDRYDVRGYLHDLKQFEPKPGSYDDTSEEEKLIDEERYRSLRTDMTEEQLYQEEELKRLRAAVASDGAYHEIGFTYENPEVKEEEPSEAKFENPDNDLYQVPEGLKVPKGMELPYNMKIHAIIEKTANFVSEQGGQMEIIIKMKQHANPQFAFMHLDNPLHPYYKHLVKEIKSGAYKPVQAKRESRSEDEDDDGHYLHPSLMAGKANDVPAFTVPTINFRRSQDDSYSLLVRNLKQHVEEAVQQNTPEQQAYMENHHIVPPPPDIQPIVNKMAEYVAKNGEDFETIVKSKKDKRFDFLYPGNEYYDYYIYQRENSKLQMSGNGCSQDGQLQTVNNFPAEDQRETVPHVSSSNSVSDSNNGTCEPSQENVGKLQASAENNSEGSSDSLDFLNSPSDSKEAKTTKILKGPISFSLKSKESEASPDIKLTPLLLGDDSDDPENEGKEGKSVEEYLYGTPKAAEVETKAQKPVNEVLEAKLAEERIRDKLLATARERLAQQRKEKLMQQEYEKRQEQQRKEKLILLDQQRKEKELQLERKRKAALFLKMLKKRNPDSAQAQSKDSHDRKTSSPEFWTLPDTSDAAGADSGILFPIDKIVISTQDVGPSLIPGIKTDWSPEAQSEESGAEGANKQSSDSDSPKQESRKRRRRRSRSRDRNRSSRRTKEHQRSKSPPRQYKVSRREKEKQLPAAYAKVNRSRSRSRSPRRYRSVPNWRRR